MFNDHIKQDIVLAFQTGGCLLLHESSAESSFTFEKPLPGFKNKKKYVSLKKLLQQDVSNLEIYGDLVL